MFSIGGALLVGGLCVLVVGWGVWMGVGWLGRVLFTENDRFMLRQIETRTDGVVQEAQLVQWVDVKLNENLFQLNLNEIRDRLESQAIIRRAVVRREMPDKLLVVVNERVAIARMGQVEGHMNWLVDAEGVLIRKSLRDRSLPHIRGVPQNVTQGDSIYDSRAGPALEILARLREMPTLKRELFEVEIVSVGHPDFLDFRLRDGTQVLLPTDGDARMLLERATRIIDQNLRDNLGVVTFNLLPEGANQIGVVQ